MKVKGAVALLPLLAACGVIAGCSAGGPVPTVNGPKVNPALNCGRVVDPDASGYLGRPLTVGHAVGLLAGVRRAGNATGISTGKLSDADRTTLDLMAVELIGYSGSRLSDDATAFAYAELRYDPSQGALNTSYAGPLAKGIAALERDCPHH